MNFLHRLLGTIKNDVIAPAQRDIAFLPGFAHLAKATSGAKMPNTGGNPYQALDDARYATNYLTPKMVNQNQYVQPATPGAQGTLPQLPSNFSASQYRLPPLRPMPKPALSVHGIDGYNPQTTPGYGELDTNNMLSPSYNSPQVSLNGGFQQNAQPSNNGMNVGVQGGIDPFGWAPSNLGNLRVR